MPSWTTYLRAGLRHPPHVTVRKAVRLGGRLVRQQAARRRDMRMPTYLAEGPKTRLRRRIHLATDEVSSDYAPLLSQASENYLAHRFDLLGSGWVEVQHGMTSAGLAGHQYAPAPPVEADAEGRWLAGRINAANLVESQRIWCLIRQPYVPIDWQLDFKSGYRWSELTYFLDIRYGNRPGADVKVPWELARMQHLPQLASAYRFARNGNSGRSTCERCAEAFRNQVLDFIATNPPRFGVNWACAMDVAVRAVNILVALDLFLDAGAAFDGPFLQLTARSILEHGRHLIGNLEWSEDGRGNHYFADIIGLLFAAAYLPRSIEADGWLAFAARELIAEASAQFMPDGGNVEGSLAYHRLSGELLLFGMALLLGLDERETEALLRSHVESNASPSQRTTALHLDEAVCGRALPIPHALFAKLAGAAGLTRHAMKPTGEITQWGDNDSGRLVKLQPAWRRIEEDVSGVISRTKPNTARSEAPLVENVLDHRSFVAAAAVLTGRDDLGRWAGTWAEGAVASALAKGSVVRTTATSVDVGDVREANLEDVLASIKSLPFGSRRVTEIAVEPGALDGVLQAAYPAFGHYAILGPRFFLAIRCPRREFGEAPGHCHDDVLAAELQVDGRNLLADPGTFVYTPLPEERNRYRAADAHSVPRPANGPGAELARGLFEIAAIPGARCLFFGARGFAGEAWGPGWRTRRAVVCGSDSVVIADGCLTGPLAPLLSSEMLPRYCRGYGCQTSHSPRLF